MKKHNFLGLFAIIILLSCGSEEEKPPISDHVISDELDSVSFEPIKEVVPENAINDAELLDAVTDFFAWYYTHNGELLNKRSSVITTEDEYWALDNSKLIAYTDWLREVNYFSSDFVNKEITTWKDDCGQQINDLINQGYTADGIPPCVFEADPFFYTQEEVSEEMVQKIEYTLKSYTDSLAVIIYDFHELPFKKENDKWKVNDWPK